MTVQMKYTQEMHEALMDKMKKCGYTMKKISLLAGMGETYLNHAKAKGYIRKDVYERMQNLVSKNDVTEGYGGKILDVPTDKDVVLKKHEEWEGKPFAERMKVIKEEPKREQKAENNTDNVFMWDDMKKWVTEMFWNGTETVDVSELAGKIKEIERCYE